MRKAKAIELLGGTPHTAAARIGITYQAVDKWPDPLPKRIEDRVVAAIGREFIPAGLLDDKRAKSTRRPSKPARSSSKALKATA